MNITQMLQCISLYSYTMSPALCTQRPPPPVSPDATLCAAPGRPQTGSANICLYGNSADGIFFPPEIHGRNKSQDQEFPCEV